MSTGEVSLPATFADRVCGICGNYDGDATEANEISNSEKIAVRKLLLISKIFLFFSFLVGEEYGKLGTSTS